MATMNASVDQERLNELLGKAIVDLGGAYHAALVVIGDKLGLYRALAADGPATSAELAARTGTAERYVRDWLNVNAAGGYVDYDPATGAYALSPEQALVLADESSPACLLGSFQMAIAALKITPRLVDAFRTGAGIGWHEHDPELFEGTERGWRPQYAAYLTTVWIPALDGVEERLRAGARVADIGCGHGASTILMAQAYPASTFVGFDFHPASVAAAEERAVAAGVADRVRFAVAGAGDYPGTGYDLVTTFDCLHDMGDPVGAAAHVARSLADDGAWMIVEPGGGDRVEENLHPLGRMRYAASAFVCTPCSLAQEVGLALGSQAGEARLREVLMAGGFSHVRRAVDSPYNLVLEARR